MERNTAGKGLNIDPYKPVVGGKRRSKARAFRLARKGQLADSVGRSGKGQQVVSMRRLLLVGTALCLGVTVFGIPPSWESSPIRPASQHARHVSDGLARRVATRLAVAEIDDQRWHHERGMPKLRDVRTMSFIFTAPWMQLRTRDVLAALSPDLLLVPDLKRVLWHEPGFQTLYALISPRPRLRRPSQISLADQLVTWLQSPSAQRQIEVSIRSQRLYLKNGSQSYATLPVSTGISVSTPRGHFQVIEKLKYPPYSLHGKYANPGSPSNPLGHAWIGLNAHHWYTGAPIGIHGTNEPQLIGSPVSSGCVRLKNADVLLICQSVPLGCPVWIHD